MKLSEFRNSLKINFKLFFANTIYTFQQETAYWTNNWANIISAGFFMISAIMFVDIIYTNVDTVASYTKDEMLFFTLVGEITFFISWNLICARPPMIIDFFAPSPDKRIVFVINIFS